MKIIFYTFIIIATITFGIYYLNPELFQSVQKDLSTKISDIIPIEPITNKTTIYKWKNNKGELLISNNPPPKGIKYITEEVQYGTNVMPSETFTGKVKK